MCSLHFIQAKQLLRQQPRADPPNRVRALTKLDIERLAMEQEQPVLCVGKQKIGNRIELKSPRILRRFFNCTFLLNRLVQKHPKAKETALERVSSADTKVQIAENVSAKSAISRKTSCFRWQTRQLPP